MSTEPLMTTISGWGPTWAPRQWTLCSGQLLAISQYQAVFSLIGTVYGGDGRTTFKLPDLRGRVPIGAGQSPGTSHYPQGALVGAEQVTLTQLEMPAHNHSATPQLASTIPATAEAGTTDTPSSTVSPAQISQRSGETIAAYGAPDGTTTLDGGTVTGSVVIGNAGGSQPFSIVQPLQAIQYIFCLEGIFPSRN